MRRLAKRATWRRAGSVGQIHPSVRPPQNAKDDKLEPEASRDPDMTRAGGDDEESTSKQEQGGDLDVKTGARLPGPRMRKPNPRYIGKQWAQ